MKSKFVFVSGAAKGHVNPMIGVAQTLVERGHEVTWLCFPVSSEQFQRAGLRAISILEESPPFDFPVDGEGLVQTFADEKRLNSWLRKLLIEAVEPALEQTRRHLRELNPDVVVFDPMLFVAAIASHLEGKVHVGLSSGLNPVTPEHFEAGIMHHVRNLSRDRAALFAKFGVPARFQNWEYLSPHGTLVFSTPEYIRQPIPDGVTLVGPARSSFIRGDEVGFPWDQLPIDGTPILYVSFGSQINYQPALFEKIIRVASKLPVFTVLSAGPLAVRYQNQKNLLAVAYAPQRELLKRTSVFISHGGANSVMEALGEGVSLLVHPLSSDQPLQARFLTEAEAGERIDLETMSDSDLANAIQRSLARVAVPRLAEITASYQAADGVKTAADFLEASLTGAESRYDSEKLI